MILRSKIYLDGSRPHRGSEPKFFLLILFKIHIFTKKIEKKSFHPLTKPIDYDTIDYRKAVLDAYRNKKILICRGIKKWEKS